MSRPTEVCGVCKGLGVVGELRGTVPQIVLPEDVCPECDEGRVPVKREPCGDCVDGIEDADRPWLADRCGTCDGSGETDVCPDCAGLGALGVRDDEMPADECSRCWGHGRVPIDTRCVRACGSVLRPGQRGPWRCEECSQVAP